MSNPFQDQLLKTGLVSKQQAHKAKQDKKNKQRKAKKGSVADESSLKIQQAADEKAKRDRELNKIKEEQARQRALSAEINQLIVNNALQRDESCEVVYNFQHNNKIKRIYINEEMKLKIMQGKLGIARIEGRYEVVPENVANKIKQRNEKRIVIFKDEKLVTDEDSAYAEYQVPDDLMW